MTTGEEKPNRAPAINGVHTMFYYENLPRATEWYDRIGFENVLRLEFVSIFRLSSSSYLSLVDGHHGSQRPVKKKGAILSIETTDLEGWHRHLFTKDVEGVGVGLDIGCGGRTVEFKLIDPEGYTLEFFQWL